MDGKLNWKSIQDPDNEERESQDAFLISTDNEMSLVGSSVHYTLSSYTLTDSTSKFGLLTGSLL